MAVKSQRSHVSYTHWVDTPSQWCDKIHPMHEPCRELACCATNNEEAIIRHGNMHKRHLNPATGILLNLIRAAKGHHFPITFKQLQEDLNLARHKRNVTRKKTRMSYTLKQILHSREQPQTPRNKWLIRIHKSQRRARLPMISQMPPVKGSNISSL